MTEMTVIHADLHFKQTLPDCCTCTSLSQSTTLLHAMLLIWTTCPYPQVLETCPPNILKIPVLGSNFFVVNFAFLLRVYLHDFRLETDLKLGWQEDSSL